MATNIEKNLTSRIGSHCWGTSSASIATLAPAARAGARWVRCTRPMQMEVVSTGPRSYNFADNGEAAVDTAVGEGMSVLGLLDGRWGQETLINKLPYASPIWEHLDLWRDFTTATVNHYKDRVRYWEILNEPPFFWWYPTAEGQVLGETGAPLLRAPIEKYAELLKASSEAIRAADPEAKILTGSGFPDGAFLERLYEFGCRDHFDIVSVHYLECRHPASFERGYNRIRHVMKKWGDEAKPLWDTESGPSGAFIGQAVETPDQYEGLYNVYRHCLAYEHGLDRYFWFNPAEFESTATHETDGSASAAYRALGTLHDFVGEGGLLSSRHFDDEAHLYVFDGPRGPISILWATAPAQVRLSSENVEATDYLGAKRSMPGEFELGEKPLYFEGDISATLEIDITGERTAVAQSVKQPASPLTIECPRVEAILGVDDDGWETVPFAATRDQVALPQGDHHFAVLSTSLPADVKLAYNDEGLMLRIRSFDSSLDASSPLGMEQFSIRDQNPAIKQWPYYTNGYGLFSLYSSPRGPIVLRHEPLLPDVHESGAVETARIEVERNEDSLVYCAFLPWVEIGDCRPGCNNPFLLMFTFNRADGFLGVPVEDVPEESSHNFADNFVVKSPALSLIVEVD